MSGFQFGLLVAMWFSLSVGVGLCLVGLEKLHQEIGEESCRDEERKLDALADDLAQQVAPRD